MPARKKSKEDTSHGRLLPLLKEAQGENGYLTPGSITGIAGRLDIPVHEAYAAASFYSFLALKPQGRHIIRICRSLPCEIKKSDEIAALIGAELGIRPGQTTPDGRFSLRFANCIGLCDQSPAMLVDDDPHVSLTPEKIRGILEMYK